MKIQSMSLALASLLMACINLVDTQAATFIVTNTNDSGAGSLRQAITDANDNVNSPTVDRIEFNIPGTAPHIIRPTGSDYDAISDPVIIDGHSQQVFQGIAVTAPIIELDGREAPDSVNSHGFEIIDTGAGTTIRGLVINNWGANGVRIWESDGNVVEGCYLGIDTTGRAARPNKINNVFLYSSSNCRIGGGTPLARNVMGGAYSSGVAINIDSSNNLVQGNIIGLSADGTVEIPNNVNGVSISPASATYASNNIIGGNSPELGNVISGNGSHGISIAGSGNQVLYNLIGTDPTGKLDFGNMSDGVRVEYDARNTIIKWNTIAFNGGIGVGVQSGSYGNTIQANSIFSNGGEYDRDLGIDLDLDDVTANDDGDADTGANELQNFPVLTSADSDQTQITIQGTLNSISAMTYKIHFYYNTEADASGYGEGQFPIGETDVTTDGSGNATFNETFYLSIPAGSVISATATDSQGNTSEFCECLEVVKQASARNAWMLYK